VSHGRKLAVIGLGYVGLPVAVAFARRGTSVIGFDIDAGRIAELKAGHDRTHEVETCDLAHASLRLTADAAEIGGADFFIVTVPTPLDKARRPDLKALTGASQTVGRVLKPGDIVVYESTVYPGATEEDCVPILEKASGLVAGRDFSVGYSPERINRATRPAAGKRAKPGSTPATATNPKHMEKINAPLGARPRAPRAAETGGVCARRVPESIR
jgi:UDP-N-acetyl-D-galactosamine dehydrogenase